MKQRVKHGLSPITIKEEEMEICKRERREREREKEEGLYYLNNDKGSNGVGDGEEEEDRPPPPSAHLRLFWQKKTSSFFFPLPQKKTLHVLICSVKLAIHQF